MRRWIPLPGMDLSQGVGYLVRREHILLIDRVFCKSLAFAPRIHLLSRSLVENVIYTNSTARFSVGGRGWGGMGLSEGISPQLRLLVSQMGEIVLLANLVWTLSDQTEPSAFCLMGGLDWEIVPADSERGKQNKNTHKHAGYSIENGHPNYCCYLAVERSICECNLPQSVYQVLQIKHNIYRQCRNILQYLGVRTTHATHTIPIYEVESESKPNQPNGHPSSW